MKLTLCTFSVMIVLVVPNAGWCKGEIKSIAVIGTAMERPLEITDSKILSKLSIWNGPGVNVCLRGKECEPQTQSKRRIVDWPKGMIAEPAADLDRYVVSVVIAGRESAPRRSMREFRFIYVMDPEAGHIYLPPFSDKDMRNELISNGVEDNWFYASGRWESLVRPIVERIVAGSDRSDTRQK